MNRVHGPSPKDQSPAKRLRVLSLSIAAISFMGLAAQLLCASMVQEGGIVAKLDLKSQEHHLVLHETNPSSEQERKDPSRRVVASGLVNAKPTQAKRALDFYSSLREEDLTGAKVLNDANGEYALVFTFYVENVSEDVDESFSFHVGLHDVSAPQNEATHPYSYLRLVVYANPLSSQSHRHTFFAAPNDLGEGTVEGGENDNRECISEYERLNERGQVLRKPIYHDEKEGYCQKFLPDVNRLIAMPCSLGPRQTMRFSVLVYFEGFDPDCIREAPVGAKMGLTAYFGENYA